MSFKLIDSGWDGLLDESLKIDHSEVLVVAPFIQVPTAKRLLAYGTPKSIRIITRFSLRDFCEGVSDPVALRLLLDCGARIRGIRNLHAKLYVFGRERGIVTSANLTEAALTRNHEFGLCADDANIVGECRQYFENLWQVAGNDLGRDRLGEWIDRLTALKLQGARLSKVLDLPDEGAVVKYSSSPGPTKASSDGRRAFVKFFGEGDNRASRDEPIIKVIESSGCHWACTFPAGRRPRQIEDGDVVFMARLVGEPADTLVFGRAIAMRHVPGRDDASDAEIIHRPWKKGWPHYIRVHQAEFVAGTLRNGVSLSELMSELWSDSLASTQRNAASGQGNTNPRRSCRQQPGVELSTIGRQWLTGKLNQTFDMHGRIPSSDLDLLDWPSRFPTP